MTTLLLTGVVLGLAGSAHCAAMCGPLVSLTRRPVRYHAARIGTYALLGAAAGASGAGLSSTGLGFLLAVIVAAVLLLEAANQWRGAAAGTARRAIGRTIATRVSAANRWLRARDLAGPVTMGALNGVLPCGLVYAALGAAAASAHAEAGAVFMMAFGAGTLPALVALTRSVQWLSARASPRLQRSVPVILALAAVLVLARGWAAAGHHH